MSRVLVADDEAQVRTFMRWALESGGHDVLEAKDGFEATELFRTEKVDVVILDIYMPNKAGVETLIDLRTDYPDVKVIAVSGGGGSFELDPLRSASTLGARLTLQKPLTAKELLDAVDTVTR